ncbi:helix-turn-helix domain-containing protein [Eubacterium ramulus]
MTQANLAEKIHVTDKAVSRWERGVSQTKRY